VLWRVSVTTAPAAEGAVAQLLEDLFEQTASSYTDLERGVTASAVYLRRKPDWPIVRAALSSRLARLRQLGLLLDPGRLSLTRMRRQDWAESWKRHFHPIEIGSRLLIKPSWSGYRPRRGQAVVVLDPGLSFGTGQHPTTAFCLEQLATARTSSSARPNTAVQQKRGARGRRHPRPWSFLDIGTGSGILAIAAAKLGYAPIEAFDFDPDAVRVARANASANSVARLIRFRRQDFSKLAVRTAKKYSLVCANLISNLLIAERARIISRVAPDGMLVLAGILKTEFQQVRVVYESAGLRLCASRSEKEWRSGAFVWQAGSSRS
jgi:ribosomal protein L11 methyltransferase